MKRYPLSHKSMDARRQGADDDLSPGDPDLSLIPAVSDMEMRRWMLAEIHRDHDPAELADSGHTATLGWPGSCVVRNL